MTRAFVSGILTAAALLSTTAYAEPEIVSGPAAEPDCFAPWTAETKFFKFPKKDGPIGWRLRMGSSPTPGASR